MNGEDFRKKPVFAQLQQHRGLLVGGVERGGAVIVRRKEIGPFGNQQKIPVVLGLQKIKDKMILAVDREGIGEPVFHGDRMINQEKAKRRNQNVGGPVRQALDKMVRQKDRKDRKKNDENTNPPF